MTELLAPAGSFEALVAAISNGADAIYLGMNRFGARAYANNFSLDELKKAIEYAHLRNVKIYVTMNTIVYDSELNDAFKQLKDIYDCQVDGVIVQDLAIFNYIVKHCPQMEAHCSTQMGIDDLEGTLLFKNLKAKRVVLSREVDIEKLKTIKKIAKMPIEIFVHGALCVSYSGNCLMSGLIGYRSGNRGRCVGSCRKQYELINTTTNEKLSTSYILSMKDLNTIDYINQLKFADSIKIEGRMKEPVYVANVVNTYRKALDGHITNQDKLNLNKTFNRTYTKGYIFNEDKKDIVNIDKPNNFGYLVGEIIAKTKQGYEIKLCDFVNQMDMLRISHNGEDINFSVSKLYDKNDNLISSSKTNCFIKIKEALSIGDKVYKTKDYNFNKELEKTFPKEYKRFNLNLYVYGHSNEAMTIECECENKKITIQSDFILEKALTTPTSKEQFIKQFNRLSDSIYQLKDIEYFVDDCFIPATKINELRRNIVAKMNEVRLKRPHKFIEDDGNIKKITFPLTSPKLAVYCTTLQQYNVAKELGVEIIYYDNIIRRNEATYPKMDKELLIGGYGGIYAYKDSNDFVTDYSLNVVNHIAVYTLHSLNAKRVTLSYELNHKQIKDLIQAYYDENGGYPNLEMIVYGRAPMMFTHYCPLKVFNQCGKCHKSNYALKDEYGVFPILNHKDCTTTILNGKILNLIDDLQDIKNINVFRVQLTTEDKLESQSIIKMFLDKIKSNRKTNLFDQNINTRGHFNKEIL